MNMSSYNFILFIFQSEMGQGVDMSTVLEVPIPTCAQSVQECVDAFLQPEVMDEGQMPLVLTVAAFGLYYSTEY